MFALKDVPLNIRVLTLFRVGGAKKIPPISFSPITSTNVGISPPKFLTFSFNLLTIAMSNFKAISTATPKLLFPNYRNAVVTKL